MDGMTVMTLMAAGKVNPNVAYLRRGTTRQSASAYGGPSAVSDSSEAYLTVVEVLLETSKGADGALSCERSGFGRQKVAGM
jgi:hypothetical protein